MAKCIKYNVVELFYYQIEAMLITLERNYWRFLSEESENLIDMTLSVLFYSWSSVGHSSKFFPLWVFCSEW